MKMRMTLMTMSCQGNRRGLHTTDWGLKVRDTCVSSEGTTGMIQMWAQWGQQGWYKCELRGDNRDDTNVSSEGTAGMIQMWAQRAQQGWYKCELRGHSRDEYFCVLRGFFFSVWIFLFLLLFLGGGKAGGSSVGYLFSSSLVELPVLFCHLLVFLCCYGRGGRGVCSIPKFWNCLKEWLPEFDLVKKTSWNSLFTTYRGSSCFSAPEQGLAQRDLLHNVQKLKFLFVSAVWQSNRLHIVQKLMFVFVWAVEQCNKLHNV